MEWIFWVIIWLLLGLIGRIIAWKTGIEPFSFGVYSERDGEKVRIAANVQGIIVGPFSILCILALLLFPKFR